MLLAFPSTFFQLRVILLKYGLVESKAHSPFQKVRVLILLSLSLKARAKYFARLSKEHAKRWLSRLHIIDPFQLTYFYKTFDSFFKMRSGK